MKSGNAAFFLTSYILPRCRDQPSPSVTSPYKGRSFSSGVTFNKGGWKYGDANLTGLGLDFFGVVYSVLFLLGSSRLFY